MAILEGDLASLSPEGTAFLRFALAKKKRDSASKFELTAPIKLAIRAQDLSSEVVDLAHQLVALQAGLDPAEERALLLVVLSALAALRQGSTRVRVGGAELAERVRALGGAATADREIGLIEAILRERRAPEIIGAPGEYRPLILDGEHLYLQRMLREEDRFAAALAARIRRGSLAVDPRAIGAALEDVLSRPVAANGIEIRLSEEQRTAVERSIAKRFSVTSGGPGTGKTSIVLTVLRVLVRLGEKPESIALAAPTGKAAKRIAESISRGLSSIASPSDEDRSLFAHAPKPETIHRLLGYSPSADRFAHHENNPLSERTVIVDESSMIDLALMARLVRAVREEARLLLLGDAEQLPSVDAGAVLRDITAEQTFATTLHQSFRVDTRDPAGKNFLWVAERIKAGDAGSLFDGIAVRSKVRDLTFSKVEMIEPDPAHAGAIREEVLKTWVRERISANDDRDIERLRTKTYRLESGAFPADEARDAEVLLAHFERFKILCITRSADFPTGARAVNAEIHERVVREARIAGANIPEPHDFVPGEPILVERNDYERKLFNGDQGIILDVREDGGESHPRAVFSVEGGLTAFHLDALRDEIALSYAITVHKSQGSEYDSVLLMLPERDIPLISREILYTALTRSRRSALILGPRSLLLGGVGRRMHRDSGVSEKLARALSA
jgi:exodeoxyribonuclease V alpha subunit